MRAAHAVRRIDIAVLTRLLDRYPCQVKFVVAEPGDLVEIDALLASLPAIAPALVLLMPLGTTAAEVAGRGRWLAELCKGRGYRYTPRLHIDLYGDRRGT